MKTLLLFLLLNIGSFTMVKDGQPAATIVHRGPHAEQAALLLQDFVCRISGATLPMEDTATGPAIIINGTPDRTLEEDGFLMKCTSDTLSITSGPGKGAVYAVATLLEQKLGVHYLAAETYTLTPAKDIAIPAFTLRDAPAFRYRQTQCYASKDPVYHDWFRLEEPRDVFAGGMWVHTFDRILPSSRYGKEHPEWYSYFGGARHPGDHSQWCLSNPEVFEAACSRLDSIFNANPGMNMISVSQNDGNGTYCTCPECARTDSVEGSPAGSLIHFLNRLAERYPDKEFSTLAYLYSMHPPKYVKPLKNVNIMLCDIDCKREQPLTGNASGRDFVRALEGWSTVSDNIFLWDYGINFDNTVSPFPNFDILQPNLQLFHKNHVQMVFEQIGGALGTDFCEMRAYLAAKLMWNPYQNTDSLKTVFLKEYYGDAAPYIGEYLDLREKKMRESGIDLWIYDSPASHKNGFLCPEMLARYDELFDKAEAAVTDDSTRLAHVQLGRLQQQYSELEIARTCTDTDPIRISALLDLFEARCRQYDIPMLNERLNHPIEYCELYRERFLPKAEKPHPATVTWINPPSERFISRAETGFTDGLYGGTTFMDSWVGWEGANADFILDYGEKISFSSVSTDFLYHTGSWILFPKGGTYWCSNDGKKWQELGSFTFGEFREEKVRYAKGTVKLDTPRKARYIKVHLEALDECPSWHFGVGHPAWFFIDEVEVR